MNVWAQHRIMSTGHLQQLLQQHTPPCITLGVPHEATASAPSILRSAQIGSHLMMHGLQGQLDHAGWQWHIKDIHDIKDTPT